MRERLPSWFIQRLPDQRAAVIQRLFDGLGLYTICQSAHCPNIGACFSRKTAAFLILGDVCTRNCTFCAVKKGVPAPVDKNEPGQILEAVEKIGLKYIVITSVTRDDLFDGGASQFATTIDLLHKNRNSAVIEVLIPDFLGSTEALRTVIQASPNVINHNVETVPRLYPEVRPQANYKRSLELLGRVKKSRPKIVTKSGLMLGLGETKQEVIEVLSELRQVNCDLVTIGQYLQPSPQHHPVIRFVPPQEFAEYIDIGKDMEFAEIASAPLVRSSFRAAELYAKALYPGKSSISDG